MSEQPTILVTNVTVENITITPGVAFDATVQGILDLAGKAKNRLGKLVNLGG